MKKTYLLITLLSLVPALNAQTIFYESFNLNNDPELGNTGGNDNEWSGNIANSAALITDNDNWNLAYASGAFECAKLGTSRNAGYAITPAIYCQGSVNLSFKAAAWGDDTDTTLMLEIRGGTTDRYSFPIPRHKWGEYNIKITDISEKITIKFSSLEKRFFLDEISVTLPDPDEADIYLPKGNMVDFGLAGYNNNGGTRTIEIVGVNLQGNISATITEDSQKAFSLSSNTLPSTGGSLDIAYSSLSEGYYTAYLVLKGKDKNNKQIEKRVGLSVEILSLDLQGDGSQLNPYTVNDVLLLNAENTWSGVQYWVVGYILGSVGTDSNGNFKEINATSKTNIVLGQTPTENNINKVITVELVSGGAAREALNVVENPDGIGKKVMVRGTLDKKYYGVPGVKGVKTEEQYILFNDITAIHTNATLQQNIDFNQPLYDILGRQVPPTYKGIVIQNGKKYLIK